MRIVINSRFLTQPITGVQRYAIELSLNLLKKLPNEVIFYSPKNILNRELAVKLNAKPIGIFTGHIWEQVELPLYLKKDDLLLNFCNTAPLLHKRKIITVHDLAFMQSEKWHSACFRMVYSILIPLLLKTTQTIITVSQTTKNEIVKCFGILPDRIFIIHNTVTPDFETFKKITTSERYLLFVGSMDPRKNLNALLSAFKRIKTEAITLKIVGGKDSNFKQQELNDVSSIEFLGRVDDYTLFQLYSNAIAFVFPSVYEGFGLPPLEAMHRGCPVIGSDIEVLHEIYGKSMLYFDPRDEQSIADAIDLICSSEEIRKELIENSKESIEKYTFEASSKRLIDLITIEKK